MNCLFLKFKGISILYLWILTFEASGSPVPPPMTTTSPPPSATSPPPSFLSPPPPSASSYNSSAEPPSSAYTSSLIYYGTAFWDSSSGYATITNSTYNSTGFAFINSTFVMMRNSSTGTCQSASFNVSFTFLISDFTPDPGDGMTFLILGPNLVLESFVTSNSYGGGQGFSYESTLRDSVGSFAVEFDTHVSKSVDTLQNGHIGIDEGFSLQSIVSRDVSEAGLNLTDSTVKYAWIEFDGGSSSLAIYVSGNNTKPVSPFIQNDTLDLCSIMRPSACSVCSNLTYVYFGFGASTGNYYETVRISNLALNTYWGNFSTSSQSNGSTVVIIAICITFTILIIVVSYLFYIYCWSKRSIPYGHKRLHEAELNVPNIFGEVIDVGCSHYTRRFTLEEVLAATNSFSENDLLGKGGFGSVYVGVFSEDEKWAVKRSRQRLSPEEMSTFVTEVKLIARVRHRNLVALKGFCDEGDEQILVYEFVPNGNLRQHIEGEAKVGNKVLSMEDRIKIAIDAAKGLEYLHQFEECPIIHCDIKSENILIGENLIAKVGDFGLSKSMDNAMTHVSADVMGTFGYLDPEYVKTRKVSTKSDVYSFGVVLLELVTGRRSNFISPNEDDEDNTTYESLVAWVRRVWQQDNVMDVTDPSLGSNYHVAIVKRLVQLALHCTKFEGRLRPSMRDVINFLEEIEHENKVMSGLLGSRYALGEVGRESESTTDGLSFRLGAYSSQSGFMDSSFAGAPVSMRPNPK